MEDVIAGAGKDEACQLAEHHCCACRSSVSGCLSHAVSRDLSGDETGDQLAQLFNLHNRLYHLAAGRGSKKAAAKQPGSSEVPTQPCAWTWGHELAPTLEPETCICLRAGHGGEEKDQGGRRG